MVHHEDRRNESTDANRPHHDGVDRLSMATHRDEPRVKTTQKTYPRGNCCGDVRGDPRSDHRSVVITVGLPGVAYVLVCGMNLGESRIPCDVRVVTPVLLRRNRFNHRGAFRPRTSAIHHRRHQVLSVLVNISSSACFSSPPHVRVSHILF